MARFAKQILKSSDADSASLLDLISYEMWQDVMERVQDSPEEARSVVVVNLFGKQTKCHPLHVLCNKTNVPQAVLDTLTAAYPLAARSTSRPSQCLPIHLACRNNMPLQAIEHLVSLYPESVMLPDIEGNLPIHLAGSLGDESTVKSLGALSPKSVRRMNKKLQTPLHMACNRYTVSADMVEMLLKHNPLAAMHQDWQGQLPLHKAITWKANLQVIELLLNVFPEGSRTYDKHALTPYTISRKIGGLDSEDPTIKLLRRYRYKHGLILSRTRDVVQFGVESVRDKARPPPKKARAAMAA
jgi:hypothetical protein